ncbi:hypothetical protein YC2023_059530 [Brassica napus]
MVDLKAFKTIWKIKVKIIQLPIVGHTADEQEDSMSIAKPVTPTLKTNLKKQTNKKMKTVSLLSRTVLHLCSSSKTNLKRQKILKESKANLKKQKKTEVTLIVKKENWKG